MEANAPPAGAWNQRLRPPGPTGWAWNPASLSPLPPWQSLHRVIAHINQSAPPP